MENSLTQDLRAQLQDFQGKLNRDPDSKELDRTPDGKAWSMPISFVEMTLDELYLGLWGTENFKWSAITNEVQGSLELVLTHPITGKEIRRTGAASVVIMVDSLSKEEKEGMTSQQRNLHALSPENKKSNALDLGFPKLKAECVKNAAQSLGKIFGRDINRKKVDVFKAVYKTLSDKGFDDLIERVRGGRLGDVVLAKSNFLLSEVQIKTLEDLHTEMVNLLSPEKPKQLANGSI